MTELDPQTLERPVEPVLAEQPIPPPGGNTTPDQAQQAAARGGDTEVDTDRATCPAPCVVTVTTRAGDIPVPGVVIYSDNRRIGTTNNDGIVSGDLSACGGNTTLKAVYQNDTARVKREEFTLPITGINVQSGTANGGQARNFIAKVQDVFGSGNGGYPGDKDFEDTYAGADLVTVGEPDGGGLTAVRITVKLATISLTVPYRNQNDSNETVQGVVQSGGALCMPTSAEMQAGYWGLELVTPSPTPGADPLREALTRHQIMQQAYNQAPTALSLLNFPRHWQDWGNMRATLQTLANSSSPNTYNVTNGPAGADVETIPSTYADGLTDLVEKGVPVITSTYATDGHIMIVIGAVVKHDDETEWLILNDPNGTLASSDSIYGEMDLQSAVGARSDPAEAINQAADVRAVQEALTRTGHYTGVVGAAIDDANPQDPTIAAIRAFQGTSGDGRIDPNGRTESRLNARVAEGSSPKYSAVENERNGATGDRGRHVYYNGGTEGARAGNFRLKGQPWTAVIEPKTDLTTAQIRARLNPGTFNPGTTP